VNPTNDSGDEPLRLDFERRLEAQFHDSHITTADRLLVYHELDDALGLTGMVGNELVICAGKNGRHTLTVLFLQSVFGRLSGYEEANDADRLGATRRCDGLSVGAP
jgi:hypothetical protein